MVYRLSVPQLYSNIPHGLFLNLNGVVYERVLISTILRYLPNGFFPGYTVARPEDNHEEKVCYGKRNGTNHSKVVEELNS
jgi:hypothetical protein